MQQSKCGCPDCRRESIPNSRNQWKGRKNHHNRTYGSHVKNMKHPKSKAR